MKTTLKQQSKTMSPVMDAACARKCQMKSIGLLALRLVFLLLMLHGIQKLTNIDGTTKFFTSIGIPMPGVAAWASGLAEGLGGLLLAVGLFTEYAGPLVVFNMLVAILTSHIAGVLKAGLPNGLLTAELPVLYLMAAFAIWMCGPGKYSLKNALGWGCIKKTGAC